MLIHSLNTAACLDVLCYPDLRSVAATWEITPQYLFPRSDMLVYESYTAVVEMPVSNANVWHAIPLW